MPPPSIADIRDRLQPALLDRLTDDARGAPASEDRRVLTKAQLRQSVLRDLAWLLNAVQPLGSVADPYPLVAESVLNFGLPPLSGQLASRINVSHVERAIREAIVRFEPRILEPSLVVKALESDNVMDSHNIIEFEIRGFLWAQPVPLELLLRTKLDLEAGQVEVRDALTSALGTARPSALTHTTGRA
jgi:type VI secretion system protein ImpF